MNDPVQLLIDDHINLAIIHHHLRDQIHRFQIRTAPETINLLINIIDYLKQYPECHHDAIEENIYQTMRLRINDAELRLQIDEINAQHQHMAMISSRIQNSLKAITHEVVVNKDIILTDCHNYLILYDTHIKAEDLHLIPNIEKYLTEEELEYFGEQLEIQQDPLFGPRRKQVYDELFIHIANTQLNAGLR